MSCLFCRWYEMMQVTDFFCLALVVTDETREYERGPPTWSLLRKTTKNNSNLVNLNVRWLCLCMTSYRHILLTQITYCPQTNRSMTRRVINDDWQVCAWIGLVFTSVAMFPQESSPSPYTRDWKKIVLMSADLCDDRTTNATIINWPWCIWRCRRREDETSQLHSLAGKSLVVVLRKSVFVWFVCVRGALESGQKQQKAKRTTMSPL
jgi:hypothetical protein